MPTFPSPSNFFSTPLPTAPTLSMHLVIPWICALLLLYTETVNNVIIIITVSSRTIDAIIIIIIITTSNIGTGTSIKLEWRVKEHMATLRLIGMEDHPLFRVTQGNCIRSGRVGSKGTVYLSASARLGLKQARLRSVSRAFIHKNINSDEPSVLPLSISTWDFTPANMTCIHAFRRRMHHISLLPSKWCPIPIILAWVP